MKDLAIKSDPAVEKQFDTYPDLVRKRLLDLRRLIIEAASETEDIDQLVETLKWGEPSYIAPKGSTIRIDWKAREPDQFAMYFKCTSKLVPSFKNVYRDVFSFEGDRAIIFKMKDPIPEFELKKCIKTALRYHVVKRQPLLGLQ